MNKFTKKEYGIKMKPYLLQWQNKDNSFLFAWYDTEKELQANLNLILSEQGNILYSGKIKHINLYFCTR